MTPPDAWWRTADSRKQLAWIPWLRPRESEAERAVTLTVQSDAPVETGSLPCGPTSPPVVSQLAIDAGNMPEFVTSIVLNGLENQTPRTRAAPGNRSRQPSSPAHTVRGSQTPGTRSLSARLRLLLAPPLECLLPGPDSILRWAGDLMPFQLDGVHTLIGSERLLLADDMGLGKTVQVIAALRVLFVRRAIESALVVAPASVLDQWRQELQKWAPELRAMIVKGTQEDRAWQWATQVHVAIVSYETLRSDVSGGPNSPPCRKIWDVLVADEAQRIKNRNATSDAMKGLNRHRSWALTGTPLENDEEELASIVEFVDHGELVSQAHYSPGLNLRLRHRELQLRRKKIDVLKDLPPKLTTKLSIPLLPKQRESYDRAEREGIIHLRELGRDVRVQHVLELITRLKQICNTDPKTGQSSKIDDIRQRVEMLTEQSNRAIVFSQYTSADFGVGAIAQALRQFDPLTFTGELDLDERRAVIQQFRSDDRHKALIVSLRAGGVGLNLQEASYVFHLDRWWNPAVERQAEDRSHRYGQTVPVHVFKYSCADTIEERIDRILETKQDLFDELVDDVSIDLGASLSADQLFGLFGLERPR